MFDSTEIQQINKIKALVSKTRRAVVTCHMSPDGDAMGSSTALYGVLRSMGIRTRIITPDEPNANLMFLPGADNVRYLSRFPDLVRKEIEEADIIFCLDYNALSRIDRLAPYLKKTSAPKVMIDHHLDPETSEMTAWISQPDRSSTCSLLYSVICQAGWQENIDTAVSTSLLAGMMTDTNNFSHNANHPEDYIIVSDLVTRGADKNKLYSVLFNTFSANCLKLNGYALSQKMEVYPEHHAALIWLSRDELNRYHYAKGDTEGLVNRPLAIPGIIYSAYLREENNLIKVSMRSKGDFPVNEICTRHFGGGGHLNAAGGEFHGSLDEAVTLFRSLLDENMRYIDNTKIFNPTHYI